ncbi:MAG: DUF6288 domain-containing protein [Lentisphaeria bacterium]|nr:DUF6288 domain-containing protein [Lentisphaeria bacterium]
MYRPNKTFILLLILVSVTAVGPYAEAKDNQFRSWKPVDYTKQEIKTTKNEGYLLGPVGVKVVIHGGDKSKGLRPQAFVSKVEKGSPAEGHLAVKDVILGVQGRPFAFADPKRLETAYPGDPRPALAAGINYAEATDGKLVFDVFQAASGQTMAVTIDLEVLGALEAGAPVKECAKTRKIIDQAAQYIVDNKQYGQLAYGAMGLLATGDPKYHPHVKEYIASWARTIPSIEATLVSGKKGAWNAGNKGILMAEYLLQTGDRTFFAEMRDNAVRIAMGQDKDGLWGHGFAYTSLNDGELHGKLAGYGAVNTAGIPCVIALVLAKKAGVEHPEVDRAIAKSTAFFRNYLYMGLIPYGCHMSQPGHDYNGKNSMTAVLFQLLGDREAEQYFAMCATSERKRESGHTGNFFHNTWGGLGANVGGPQAAMAYFSSQAWYHTLVRSWNHSFRYQHEFGSPQNSYSGCSLTGSYLLNMVANRRQLYITGKEQDPASFLSSEQLAECEYAYKLSTQEVSMNDKTTAELARDLSSWSSTLRHKAAEVLAARSNEDPEILPTVLPLLKADARRTKVGALWVLKNMGKRAVEAGPAVAAMLPVSEDEMLTMHCLNAIVALGDRSKASLEPVLHDAIRVFPNEIFGLRQFNLLDATLKIMLGPDRPSKLFPRENPFTFLKTHGVDEDLYLRAMERMCTSKGDRTGWALSNIEKYYSTDQICEILDGILVHAQDTEWAGDVFRFLAERRVEEALPRIWERADTDIAGRDTTELLPHYGTKAQIYLPRLKEIQAETGRDLSKTISALESAQPVELLNLRNYFMNRYGNAIKALPKSEQIRYCASEWAKSMDQAYVRRGVLLEIIHALNPEAARKRIVGSLGPGKTRLEATAIRLASTYAPATLRSLMTQEKDSSAILAGLLLAADKTEPVALSAAEFARFLGYPSARVRTAATEALGNMGTVSQVRPLMDAMARTSVAYELLAMRNALIDISSREPIAADDLLHLREKLGEQAAASTMDDTFNNVRPMAYVIGAVADDAFLLETKQIFEAKAKERAQEVGVQMVASTPEKALIAALTQGYLDRLFAGRVAWDPIMIGELQKSGVTFGKRATGETKQIATFFCVQLLSEQAPAKLTPMLMEWLQAHKDIPGMDGRVKVLLKQCLEHEI